MTMRSSLQFFLSAPPERRRRRWRRSAGVVAVVVGVSSGLGPAEAIGPHRARAVAATPPCTSTDPGGSWSLYGRDRANTRTQPDEQGLTPAVAASLAPSWVFSTFDAGEPNQAPINGTPVVAGGCVYFGSGGGFVYALDADTGAIIWRTQLPVALKGIGGAIVGSVAVDGNRLLVVVNQLNAPYAAALDRRTGAVLWSSAPIDTFPGSYTNASAAVFKNLLMVGFSTDEGDSQGQGGFAILDTATGAILKKTYTVPLADQALGYAGGGIWATPAIDPATKHAYVGSGNPFSKTIEHPHTNSILKIDLNQDRATFGEIVDYYKGNIDQYLPQLAPLRDTPVCSETEFLFDPSDIDSPACGQLDLDFGASPNLFVDAQGRTLVGELQKSGVYHVADTATMDLAWTQIMGGSCFLCNAASTAFDGAAVYGVGTPGGVMSSLARDSGSVRWAQPVADGTHYQPTSTAAGVTYVVDANGLFRGFDSATGSPVLTRVVSADIGRTDLATGIGSNGIAIARHTVFAAIAAGQNNGYVIAYRPR
jgi:polyvinyl alcohol dehydrogenase (cytochrome)